MSASAPPPASAGSVNQPAGPQAGADDAAQLARRHLRPQPARLGLEAPTVRHHERRATGLAGRHHGRRLGRVHSHGLLHHHGHTGVQRGNGLSGVQRVGGVHQQAVDFPGGQQFFHRGVGARHIELSRELGGALWPVVDHGDQLGAGYGAHGQRV
jgi:hypothetical protein